MKMLLRDLAQIRLQVLLKGMATMIPGLSHVTFKRNKFKGTISARYCYSVWLRHLTMLSSHGVSAVPQTVLEIGPGNSLGTGIAALLSGANTLYAFDAETFSDTQRNLKIFDKLVGLFLSKADIPGEAEFPEMKPFLKSYKFPHSFLNEAVLKEALNDKRLKAIRAAIAGLNTTNSHSSQIQIRYCNALQASEVIHDNSIDFLYSQAVLQHANDLQGFYAKMFQWLKPKGVMTHQIDLRSLNTTRDWYGHWMISDFVWNLARGQRPYFLNRETCSGHLQKLKGCGFCVIDVLKNYQESKIAKKDLSPHFQGLSDEDLRISGIFVIAKKDI